MIRQIVTCGFGSCGGICGALPFRDRAASSDVPDDGGSRHNDNRYARAYRRVYCFYNLSPDEKRRREVVGCRGRRQDDGGTPFDKGESPGPPP